MTARSLRSRLFLMIVPPLIGIAAVAAIVRYQMAEQTSRTLYDETLLAVALTISRDVVLSEGDVLAEELLAALTQALGDPIYYRVVGPDGRFVTGYSDLPPTPSDVKVEGGIPRFFDSTYHGEPVRVVKLREFISEPQFGGWVSVEVWQTTIQRRALSMRLALEAGVLMAIIIATAATIVWFGINRGLRPLLDLRDAVALRSTDDLRPIRRAVPREVEGLVATMNSLFGQLSAAFAERERFIADAAHQLRNPIAAIKAQAESAISARNEGELRRRTLDIAAAANRTGRLTQQLLSMEKIRGRTRHDANCVDLVAIAAEVLRRQGPEALRRGAELSFDAPSTPLTVMGDPVLFAEAMDNLIDNALRYGCHPGGSIAVSLRAEQGRVVVAVEDSGPGVPEADRARMFERFYRGVEDGSDGCGLGLAITRETIERFGGSISVEDARPGARFVLNLPAAKPIHQTDGADRVIA
jgi:two-component system sensor histidine kinase TctE